MTKTNTSSKIRLFTVLATLGMFLTVAGGAFLSNFLVPKKAFAEFEGLQYEYDATYNDNEGGYSVYYGNPSSKTEIVIPESYNDGTNGEKPVFAISSEERAFMGAGNIETVSIPASIVEITGNPFFGCTNLTAITVHEDNLNFSSQDGVLYDKVKTIIYSYPSAKSDTSFTILETVASISNVGVFEVNYSAFNNCKSLTAITVDANNDNFSSQDGVLYNKNGTTLLFYPTGKTGASYTLPSAVTKIDDSAFEGTGITIITIPASVVTIGKNAFKDCTDLAEVIFETGSVLESIGESAFEGTALETITLPATVETIGQKAFYNLSTLTAINVDSENLEYSSENGILYNKSKTILIVYPAGKTGDDLTLSATLVEIGENSFAGTKVKNIVIANNNDLTTINSGAFMNSSLETFAFGTNSSIKTLGESAFSGTAIKTIIIPNSVTSLQNAFEGSALETLIFEDGSELSDLEGVIYGAANLKTLQLAKNGALTTITKGFYHQLIDDGPIEVLHGQALESIFIPATVGIIHSEALQLPNLKTITLERSSGLLTVFEADALLPTSGLPGGFSISVSAGDLFAYRGESNLAAYANYMNSSILIEISNANKIYGQADPTFEYVIKNEENEIIDIDEVFSSTLDISLKRQAGKNVGEYVIEMDSASIDSLESLGIFYSEQKGRLTITPKEILIKITKDFEKTEGGEDPEIEYEIEGLEEGDSLTGKIARVRGERAGEYDFDLGTLRNANYTLVLVTENKFIINPKPFNFMSLIIILGSFLALSGIASVFVILNKKRLNR